MPLRILHDAVDAQTLRIRDPDAELRRRALELMERYRDLRLTYVDCIGATVAREIEASAVFGLDHDFRVMGFAWSRDGLGHSLQASGRPSSPTPRTKPRKSSSWSAKSSRSSVAFRRTRARRSGSSWIP